MPMYRGPRGARASKANTRIIAHSPWVGAIENATAIVLNKSKIDQQQGYGNGGSPSRRHGVVLPTMAATTVEEIDHSLAYLIQLDAILQEHEKDMPPTTIPPDFEPFTLALSPPSSPSRCGYSISGSPTTTPTRNTIRSTGIAAHPPGPLKGNQFESIAWSDDEDDEEEKKEADHALLSQDEDNEAGDKPLLFLSPDAKPFVPELDTLRLLIRLYVSKADLYAYKARLLSYDYQWMPGVIALQSAVAALRYGMELADAEISKYMMQDVGYYSSSYIVPGNSSIRRRFALERDADIVHVSTQSLCKEQTRYLLMAERHLDRLKQNLEPNYAGRSRAKASMGKQWYNNPNPKNTYWKMQQKMEEELFILEKAIEALMASSDIAEMSVAAQQLKEKIRETWYQKNRYNGQLSASNKNRLPGYAFPEEEGWIQTGSMDHEVEFFEKQVIEEVPADSKNMVAYVVRMDWYYTTGLVKMTMEDAVEGTVVLLEKRVRPKSFLLLLQRPKTAPDLVRYHVEPQPVVSRKDGKRSNRGKGTCTIEN
jgi:hypothetical protein